MKQIIIIIAALIAIQTAPAQPHSSKNVSLATKNLLTGLRSGNPGVMESAMRLTAQMRIKFPAADIGVLTDAVAVIRNSHPSGVMRYKAYVTLAVCENPEWYVGDPTVAAGHEEEFFRAASDRMQQQLLSSAE